MELSPINKEDMPKLKEFAKLFVEETGRYPLSWWRQAVPPFIVFVKVVKVNGEIVGGVEQGAVIYNISEIKNRDGSRQVIHHELMHWLELASRTRMDPEWPGAGTSYLKHYDVTNPDNYIEHPEKGFITGYAKTNSLEDKAEIYAYLFTSAGRKKLMRWISTDEELKKKVMYIQTFIERRIPKMDTIYFDTYVRD